MSVISESSATEQIFDRQLAVEFHSRFVVESGEMSIRMCQLTESKCRVSDLFSARRPVQLDGFCGATRRFSNAFLQQKYHNANMGVAAMMAIITGSKR